MNSCIAHHHGGTYAMPDLFEQIIDYDNLLFSYKKVLTGARKYRKDAILFSLYEDRNLVELWLDLKRQNYHPSNYIEFKVYEPKERVIHAPRVRDKIVQFAIHNVIKHIYSKVFIKHSYACQENRGTHAAVEQVQKNLRICEREFDDPWIVKLDVSKFFYSIDREILKKILRKKIKCVRTLRLLDIVVDSSPEGDKGIPLGNVTSQDFANIYLNELDQFATRFLKIRYYVRYMDDVIAVLPNKEAAKKAMKQMSDFISNSLNMNVNPKKTQIFPLKQGVNAYGYKIWTTHKLVRSESKNTMKRKMRKMEYKRLKGEIDIKQIQQSASAWIGHARHSNSYTLCKKLFKPYPYIQIKGADYFGKRRH